MIAAIGDFFSWFLDWLPPRTYAPAEAVGWEEDFYGFNCVFCEDPLPGAHWVRDDDIAMRACDICVEPLLDGPHNWSEEHDASVV